MLSFLVFKSCSYESDGFFLCEFFIQNLVVSDFVPLLGIMSKTYKTNNGRSVSITGLRAFKPRPFPLSLPRSHPFSSLSDLYDMMWLFWL